ncbi:hypothetical protein [Halobacteriovorax marinus]|uniref:hypothetical protein n=1 Tax=Halobacteriovorax marinus TaxID=97084 RepID=UPI003A93A5E0
MRTLLFIKILFLSFVFSNNANAEYRVYQYYVKSKLRMPIDQNGYLVTSTLDPVSYISYNGGANALKVDLLRSWVCVGHTGEHKELCKGPEENSGVFAQK